MNMLLLSLLACKGGDDKGGSADSAQTDAPYVVDASELDLPEPSFDAQTAAAGVEAALEATTRVNVDPIVAAYEAAITEADDDCPTYYRGDDGSYWYDDCTAESGARFNGYGAAYTYEDVDDGGYLYNGAAVYGVAEITTADGRVLSLNGGAVQAVGESDEGVTLRQEQIFGEFAWTGDEASGTWLEEGLDPQLSHMTISLGDAWGVGLEGGISGLPGEVDTVVFDGLLLASTSTGSPCEQEPGGTISLRSADGQWVDVLFDVPWDPETESWGEMEPDTCDGCGAAWSRGVALGEVCVDFSGLAVE